MPITSYSAQQTTLWIQPNSTGSFVQIAQATSIKPPGINRIFDDITVLDAADGFKQYGQVSNDTSTCTFDTIWYPGDAGQAAFEVQANLATGQTDKYEIRMPQVSVTAKFAFDGIAQKSEPDMKTSSIIRSSCEIRTTGPRVYTA